MASSTSRLHCIADGLTAGSVRRPWKTRKPGASRLAFLQNERADDRGHACGLRRIGRCGDRIPARDGGFRRLSRRGAARLEALLERFQLALAALRGDGLGGRNAERHLEVEEQRLTLCAALVQLRYCGLLRGGKPPLQRLLAVHAERRERRPGAR